MIKNYIGIFIIFILVAAAVAYGFTSSGSPAKIRAQKFDQQRSLHLSSLSYSINNYYSKNGILPPTLGDAYSISSYSLREVPKDPETKENYEYIPGAGGSYKLCAVFSEKSSEEDVKDVYERSVLMYESNLNQHPKGYYCASFTAPARRTNTYQPTDFRQYTTPTITPTIFSPSPTL